MYQTKHKNVTIQVGDKIIEKTATGNGPIAASINALKDMGIEFEFKNYIQQSSRDNEESSAAITYINICKGNKNIWAIGKDEDVIKSSLLGIVSAVNKL